MQVALLDTTRPVDGQGSAAKIAAGSTAGGSGAPASSTSQSGQPSAAPVPRGGLKVYSPQFNRQVAVAQQSLDYLDGLAGQLRGLHASLTKAQAAGSGSAPRQVQQQVQAVQATWSQRQSATAGSLDAQLNLAAPGQAQQKFTVSGLDIDALASGGPETLSLNFNINGQKGTASVALAPGLSAQDIARRFDRALAPSGVRASLGANDQLELSVNESSAAGVRDTLSIKGEGRRFPAGPFHRVASTIQSAAIAPENWPAGATAVGGSATQSLRQSVRDAYQKVSTAYRNVGGALRDAATRLNASSTSGASGATGGSGAAGASGAVATAPADDASWSDSFTKTFETTGSSGGFGSLTSVASAVAGVSRQRTLSLLTLPASD